MHGSEAAFRWRLQTGSKKTACMDCSELPRAFLSSLGRTLKLLPPFQILGCKNLPQGFLQWSTNNRVSPNRTANCPLGPEKKDRLASFTEIVSICPIAAGPMACSVPLKPAPERLRPAHSNHCQPDVNDPRPSTWVSPVDGIPRIHWPIFKGSH